MIAVNNMVWALTQAQKSSILPLRRLRIRGIPPLTRGQSSPVLQTAASASAPNCRVEHPPIVFHANYSIPWPEKHRFAMWKFRDLADNLISSGIVASENDFIQPDMPPDEWMLSVHCSEYYKAFVQGTLDDAMMRRTGFSQRPDHDSLVRRTKLEVAGTVLTARLALMHGIALHIGGGTHHAHTNWGAGYTCLNDMAIAARVMQREGRAERIMVVDCDVHQGDGTAEIFRNDPSVFTLSMHCGDNFPFGFTAKSLSYLGKDKSDLDIAIPMGTGDETYMRLLRRHLPQVIHKFKPDLLLYIGGIDVWEGDGLGKLKITEAGIFERDLYVVELAMRMGVPIGCMIGGGYDQNREALAYRHSLVHRAAIQVWNQLKRR